MLASDTPPVREVIRDGDTGLLAPFHDIDRWCEQANAVLDNPAAFRPLGRTACQLVRGCYSVEVCLPRLRKLYQDAAGRSRVARLRRRVAASEFALAGIAV